MKVFPRIVATLFLFGQIPAAGEPPHLLPHEQPWTGKPMSNEPVIEGLTIRAWMAATVFPEFKFSGVLEEAISYLMNESRKVTPGGRTIGGFVLRDPDETLLDAKIDLHLKGKNALEIIDALCGAAKTTWMLSPHAIIIGADGGRPVNGVYPKEDVPDPFAPIIKDQSR